MKNDKACDQEEIDLAELGDIHLRNWGAMLAAQPNPGPRGFTSQPMFKDMKTGYRQESDADLNYIEDEARLTDDIVNFTRQSEKVIAALHCYYVVRSSRNSLELATQRFNRWATTRYESETAHVSRSSFCTLIRDIKIQVAASHILNLHSALDLAVVKELAQMNRVAA